MLSNQRELVVQARAQGAGVSLGTCRAPPERYATGTTVSLEVGKMQIVTPPKKNLRTCLELSVSLRGALVLATHLIAGDTGSCGDMFSLSAFSSSATQCTPAGV